MRILFLLFKQLKVLFFLFLDDGWIFMVMEYCDQGNLFSIQKDKPNQLFSFDETGEILE